MGMGMDEGTEYIRDNKNEGNRLKYLYSEPRGTSGTGSSTSYLPFKFWALVSSMLYSSRFFEHV